MTTVTQLPLPEKGRGHPVGDVSNSTLGEQYGKSNLLEQVRVEVHGQAHDPEIGCTGNRWRLFVTLVR
jgi:hypothetical protein